MLEKFLKQSSFTSHQDFVDNYAILVPENFNFAYDVVDEWAKTHPARRALCWTNDKGQHKDLNFSQLKELSDKTASFLLSPGIRKGDMAWRDEDGYYWFVGRTDDIIKSSGYRIGPFEVESAVMTHPAVVECAITGVPDEIRGQVIKATIVLAPQYKEKADDKLARDIQEHVKNVTAPYKYPASLNS